MSNDFEGQDAQVWWVPNPPREPFTYPVSDLHEAAVTLMVLTNYDNFLGGGLIGSNAGGLRVRKMVTPETKPEDVEEWEDWLSDRDEDIWAYLDRRYMFP